MTAAEDEEREARVAAFTQLLAAAETATEINALTRVGRRAGFLWRCPGCREDVYANRDVCSCRTARPA